MKSAVAAALLCLGACAEAQATRISPASIGTRSAEAPLQPVAAAAPANAVQVPAAVTSDPPRDDAYPARNRQLLIPSGGYGMNALFFLASGAGPKPTMLLLHGLPGNERNVDLAQAVRRAGWNVLTFTYRGAWGSPGTFSIANAIDDAGAAIAFLRSDETARAYNVDPRRLVIAGHSMGGLAAAVQAAGDDSYVPGPRQPLAGLVLLDAADFGKRAADLNAGGAEARAKFLAAFDDVGNSLGPVKAPDLADELIRRGEAWSLGPLAPRLARTPVLTIYATHGGAAHNRAFAEALRAQPGAMVTAVELTTDHGFADKRIALAAEVVRWLQQVPE